MPSFYDTVRSMNGMVLGSANPDAFLRKMGITARVSDIRAYQTRMFAEADQLLADVARHFPPRAKPASTAASYRRRIDDEWARTLKATAGETWVTAMHEAGHGLLAQQARVPVLQLTTIGGNGATVADWIGAGLKPTPRVLAAGVVAEFLNRHGKQAMPRVTSLNFHADERRRFEASCLTHDVDQQAVVDATGRELRTNWAKVERLAARLTLAGELSGDELDDLLR